MIMQKWDTGFGNFELEFLFKISRKLNLMESQRYLFHVLKGKFPLLSRKARDEECYFFLFFFFSIYSSHAVTLSKLPVFFIPLGWAATIQCHFSPVSGLQLQLRLSHNSSGSDGSQSPVHLLRVDTAHPPWSKTNCLKLPACSRATLANPILQGVTPPCHSGFLGVDTVLWVNICYCYSTGSHSDSPETKMKTCFGASCCLLHLRSLCISSGLLNSCDQRTPCALLSLKHHFNSQLLTLNPQQQWHSSGFLAVHMTISPFFHFSIPEPRGNYNICFAAYGNGEETDKQRKN